MSIGGGGASADVAACPRDIGSFSSPVTFCHPRLLLGRRIVSTGSLAHWTTRSPARAGLQVARPAARLLEVATAQGRALRGTRPAARSIMFLQTIK